MFRIEPWFDGDHATGKITIGSFSETFGLELQTWTPSTYVADWRRALTELVAGGSRVALMTWTVPPGPDVTQRAWILYREGLAVFVQDRLFPSEATDKIVDPEGRVTDFGPRITVSETGDAISEWQTTISEIDAFLRQPGAP